MPHGADVEETFGREPVGRERVVERSGQRPPEPVAERHAEALLAALEDLGRRSEEHTSELQSLRHLVCRLLLEKKKKKHTKAEELYHDSTASTYETRRHE